MTNQGEMDSLFSDSISCLKSSPGFDQLHICTLAFLYSFVFPIISDCLFFNNNLRSCEIILVMMLISYNSAFPLQRPSSLSLLFSLQLGQVAL